MKNIEVREALKNAGVTHEELASALRTDKKALENRLYRRELSPIEETHLLKAIEQLEAKRRERRNS